MPANYERLPNGPEPTNGNREMEDAFESDEENEFEDARDEETRPLNRTQASSHPLDGPPGSHTSALAPASNTQQEIPGTYDFNNTTDFDYIRPPPGAPVPMEGNSNGTIPVFDHVPPRRSWFGRATAILPSHIADRLGLAPRRTTGVVGGGLQNDGVFANVTAKPAAPRTVQEGDETFMVPEDTRAEAPPSYAAAQADSVPPYWAETTVFAPAGSEGEMIIDDLPVGSVFSFMWNMLISVTFQFIGFLLTYLLHTSHAARYGSRAGLGISLIQYGFALRGRMSDDTSAGGGVEDNWGWNRPLDEVTKPVPSFATAADAAAYNSAMGISNPAWNATTYQDQQEMAQMMAQATTEWMSFFLMTIGWFVLLTSALGYYRVKRWESGILASQAPRTTPEEDRVITSRLQRAFGLSSNDIMAEFGLRRPPAAEASAPRESDDQTRYGPRDGEDDEESSARRAARTRRDRDGAGVEEETESMLPGESTDDPTRHAAMEAYGREVRLQIALRDAGLL